MPSSSTDTTRAWTLRTECGLSRSCGKSGYETLRDDVPRRLREADRAVLTTLASCSKALNADELRRVGSQWRIDPSFSSAVEAEPAPTKSGRAATARTLTYSCSCNAPVESIRGISVAARVAGKLRDACATKVVSGMELGEYRAVSKRVRPRCRGRRGA